MFNDAKKLYNNAKFIQAYEKFYILHTRNEKDNYVTIYLAKTSYNIGEFEKAKKILLPLYKRSHNSEAGLYLAKIYFYEKNYAEAKNILKLITEKPYKKEVKKYLEMIKNRTKLHSFTAYVSVGITNDNNTHNDTYKLDNKPNIKEDNFIDTVLYISHQYKIPNSSGAKWNDNLLIYNKSGLKYADENFFLASLKSGPSFTKYGLYIKPHIIFKDMYYKSHHYMYDYGLGLKIYKNINDTFDANMQLSYEKYKYIQSVDTTRDSKNLSLSLKINHYLSNKSLIKYLLSFSNVTKDKPGRIDISRKEYSLDLGYTKKISNGLNLNLNLQYKDFAYTDRNSDSRLRDDRRTTYFIGLSKKIKKYFTVSLNYNHIDNDSNIDWNSYRKDTLNLTISKIF